MLPHLFSRLQVDLAWTTNALYQPLAQSRSPLIRGSLLTCAIHSDLRPKHDQFSQIHVPPDGANAHQGLLDRAYLGDRVARSPGWHPLEVSHVVLH